MERKPKSNDHENIDRAFKLLNDLVKSANIEASLWVPACIAACAEAFYQSGYSSERFMQEMYKITKHYKEYFYNE